MGKFKLYKRYFLAALLILVVVLEGCALQHPSPVEKEYKAVAGPAAMLFSKSEMAMEQGNYAKASMYLERALRIEPGNAHYWYSLGVVKYNLGQYSQAQQFCLKSESLAGNQPLLLTRIQELLKKAKI